MTAERPKPDAEPQPEGTTYTLAVGGELRPTSSLVHQRIGAFVRVVKGAFKPRSGTRRGHPHAFDPSDDSRFAARLKEAAHTAVKNGELVNYASLERNGMGIGWVTIKKYVEHFGYDLAAIQTEATRCTVPPNNCRFIVRDRAKFKKKQA